MWIHWSQHILSNTPNHWTLIFLPVQMRSHLDWRKQPPAKRRFFPNQMRVKLIHVLKVTAVCQIDAFPKIRVGKYREFISLKLPFQSYHHLSINKRYYLTVIHTADLKKRWITADKSKSKLFVWKFTSFYIQIYTQKQG